MFHQRKSSWMDWFICCCYIDCFSAALLIHSCYGTLSDWSGGTLTEITYGREQRVVLWSHNMNTSNVTPKRVMQTWIMTWACIIYPDDQDEFGVRNQLNVLLGTCNWLHKRCTEQFWPLWYLVAIPTVVSSCEHYSQHNFNIKLFHGLENCLANRVTLLPMVLFGHPWLNCSSSTKSTMQLVEEDSSFVELRLTRIILSVLICSLQRSSYNSQTWMFNIISNNVMFN